MGTVIRAEISKKGKWWISKHRYYELKHYCLQYKEMKEELESLIKLLALFVIFQDRLAMPETELVILLLRGHT